MQTRTDQRGQGPGRTIVFVPGFDPRGGRHYARVFAEQLTAAFGDAVAIRRHASPRKGWLSYGVRVAAEDGDHETRLVIAGWERIVLALIRRGRLATAAAGCVAFAYCCLTGILGRLFRLNWRFALAYTVVFAWPAVCAIASVALVGLFPLAAWSWLVAVGLSLSVIGYWWVYLREPYRRYVLWSWTFALDCSKPTRFFRKTEPAYDAYVDDIARFVTREAADGREVVLVGHSIGAIPMVRAAGILSSVSSFEPRGGSAVSLLTLGGAWAIGTQYSGRNARRMRADVRRILAAPGLRWTDVCAWEDVLSCPDTRNKMPMICGQPVPDGAGFEYVDPELPTRWPADFYRRNVRNFSEIHFDYLLPPRRHAKSDFDLYRLFAGHSA